MSAINLTLAGRSIELEATDREPRTYAATGQPMRELEISLTAGAEVADEVLDELREARDMDSGAGLVDSEGASWRVLDYDYTWRDRDDAKVFTASLLELPTPPTVSSLRFLELDVPVDYYRDEVQHPADPASDWHFAAEFLTSGDATDALQPNSSRNPPRTPIYFEFTRVGVDETPLRARLGQVVWADADAGQRRWHAVFVTEESDGHETSGDGFVDTLHRLHEPARSNVQRYAVRLRAEMAQLVQELEDAGALGDEAVARVRAAGENMVNSFDMDLLRVRDVSEFR